MRYFLGEVIQDGAENADERRKNLLQSPPQYHRIPNYHRMPKIRMRCPNVERKTYILFWVNFIVGCGAVEGQLTDWAFLFHQWKSEDKVTLSSVVELDYSHASHVHILVDHEHHVVVLVFTANDWQQHIQNISAISSLDDETYGSCLDLLKGKFNVHLKQETTSRSPLWYDFGEIATMFL